ncbi:MAG: hypothetical protein ACXAEI_14135 [Candidatus Hodarchaeales archaeon]
MSQTPLFINTASGNRSMTGHCSYNTSAPNFLPGPSQLVVVETANLIIIGPTVPHFMDKLGQCPSLHGIKDSGPPLRHFGGEN